MSNEPAKIDKEPTEEEHTWSEQIEIAASELVERTKELIEEGNVRRLIIRTQDDELSVLAPSALIHPAAERNCPKSPRRFYNVALQATVMVLFGPFCRPYIGQIYGRSVTHTPFRTVSEGELPETS